LFQYVIFLKDFSRFVKRFFAFFLYFLAFFEINAATSASMRPLSSFLMVFVLAAHRSTGNTADNFNLAFALQIMAESVVTSTE
jgi:hypothetical protein